jgi:DNA replication protein DnaC
MWAALATRADKEDWPAARFLAALAEHEIADRGRCRIERHLASARLPAGKTFDTFDFNAVPHGQQGAGHGARRRRQLA